MKPIILRAACIAAILCSPWAADSQSYYVVVGAFAAEENASEFKGYLPNQYKDTTYVSNKEENLQLYVVRTTDKQAAMATTDELKKEVEALNESSPVVRETTGGGASSGFRSANSGAVPPKAMGKLFKFTIETPEGTLAPGTLHHVDPASERELATYEADTYVDLLRPGLNSKPMAVVCGLFGYKEIHKYIDYSDPSAMDKEAYVDANGSWVIPYKLERLERGDVSPMYNVSFYKDAVIMRKPSQQDLDELVRMMKINPYYEITIHAHCNGKNKREIIALGPNRNYFDVNGAVTVQGTAKDLTLMRAEAVRTYLEEHGIDGTRAKIFSWGGSDMLVRGEDALASLNDRIEIEITRD